MCLQERLDIGKQIVHAASMRRINPSVNSGDGQIRKLSRINPYSISTGEMSAHMDIELIRDVLRQVTGESGPFSQRGLSAKAGLGRDAVGDIINGRNKNPTIASLIALADAMDKPLSVFGFHFVSEPELRRTIHEALPNMPSRGRERQARYLAEVVSDALGLPKDRPATDADPRDRRKSEPSEGKPPPSPTS
jgi:transcriptional regulator with XRE-family HTH domain